MKTKNLTFCVTLLILLRAVISNAQETLVAENPLNENAFDKNIMQDLNFMVLGDNNLKQGVSYEYDEKRTELALTGLLASRKSYMITVDGAFSVDDGVFIFDNKDGSTKGTASINLFVPFFWGNGKYYPASEGNVNSGKANRAKHLNKLEEGLPEKVADTFKTLDAIMAQLGLPRSDVKQENGGLFGGKLDRQNNLVIADIVDKGKVATKDELLKTLLKYYTAPNGKKYTDYDILIKDINAGKSTKATIKGKKHSITYQVPEGLNIVALFNDYDKILERAKSIDEEVSDKQIGRFKDIWTVEYNTYVGFSPYYERESLSTYKSDETITEFSDRFTDQRGDLYGAKLSLNNVWRFKRGWFAMARGLATFGRASNFKDFEKRDYLYNSLPQPIGTGTVTEEQKKTAYYTDNGLPYQYGFYQKYSFELYLSSKVIGAYGKFGYAKNDARLKQETLPLETGIMINLQSEKKNVVSILLFVAREDLNMHPDNDTNFGFKIGLPINIKKSGGEKEKEKG